jgi:hypothetical protein
MEEDVIEMATRSVCVCMYLCEWVYVGMCLYVIVCGVYVRCM